MTLDIFKANQRIEAALRTKDLRELRWSLNYARSQVKSEPDARKKFWRDRAATLAAAVREAELNAVP